MRSREFAEDLNLEDNVDPKMYEMDSVLQMLNLFPSCNFSFKTQVFALRKIPTCKYVMSSRSPTSFTYMYQKKMFA